MSEVVRRFEPSPDRNVTTMTLDDVDHYSVEEKEKIAASYAAHEREARTKGIPTLGSGRIFPVSDHMFEIEQRDLPSHWPRIGGMDFGWDHPFAAVELVWDRDTDTVYVSKCYRIRESTPVVHAAALKVWGKELRWAWPRDGRRETWRVPVSRLRINTERRGWMCCMSMRNSRMDQPVSRPAFRTCWFGWKGGASRFSSI